MRVIYFKTQICMHFTDVITKQHNKIVSSNMKKNIFNIQLQDVVKTYLRNCFLYLNIIFLIVILISCTNDLSKKVTELSTRYPHLSSALDKYNDGDFLRAAYFIFCNIPSNEIYNFNCDSIICSIDTSIKVWQRVPWKSNYRQIDFEEYILPYRIGNEPLEYSWKWVLPHEMGIDIAQYNSLSIAAQKVNKKVIIKTFPNAFGNDIQSYTSLLKRPIGKCDDRAVFTVMAMRSNGIPSAFECIPYWGDANNGHAFCSVINPDGKLMVFQDFGDDGLNVSFAHKTPKIYRKMFSKQINTPLYKYKDVESLPTFFSDFDKMDITDKHKIKQRDVKVNMNSTECKIAYLSVFSPKGWIPVAYAENVGGYALFKNVGTGEDIVVDGKYYSDKHITEKGILYLPSFYTYDGIKPASCPIIVSNNQVKELRCIQECRDDVILYRKYPLSKRVINYANSMLGGIFEGANKSDFSDAVELYYINDTPFTRMQRIVLTNKKKFKYLRYRKPKGNFSLAELKFFNDEEREIKGKLIHSNALDEDSLVRKIMDNDILSYYTLPNSIDVWVGVAVDNPQIVTYIEFCPRTDDNDISPGDIYELFYWNDKWISLGKKRADDYQIKFDNIPHNSLLWLKDLSKGKEERPFTINNGIQIWW